MTTPASPMERLLLASFRKLPAKEQVRMLRQAKAAARNPRPPRPS